MNTLTATDLIKEISINWRDIYKMERENIETKKTNKRVGKKNSLKFVIMNGNMIHRADHMKG